MKAHKSQGSGHAGILLVDDDTIELKWLEHRVKKLGLGCFSTHDHLRAMELISKRRPEIILTDLVMPKKDGLTLLREVKEFDPSILVIIMTAHGTVASAVQALQAGAFDYIEKPFTEDKLKALLRRAIQHRQADGAEFAEQHQLTDVNCFGRIIGKSNVMRNLFEEAIKIAKSDSNVMIYGESGTGKELLARSIHANSSRSSLGFIPVDCVALPETLLESELFGYEKGAFTGAESTRRGLLEYSDRGTLFLDEICELAPNLQAKLLRVLQEREFRRIGGKKLIKVDLRIISATNIEPAEAVRMRHLRADLYYRLNVIPLILPPLRDRKEDIPLLVNYFFEKLSRSTNFGKKSVSSTVMDTLVNCPWPGNVRELENIIERLVSLTDGAMILETDLPQYLTASAEHEHMELEEMSKLPYRIARNRVVDNFDKCYFQTLLEECQGNISKAAKVAKVNRTTLYRKIDKISS